MGRRKARCGGCAGGGGAAHAGTCRHAARHPGTVCAAAAGGQWRGPAAAGRRGGGGAAAGCAAAPHQAAAQMAADAAGGPAGHAGALPRPAQRRWGPRASAPAPPHCRTGVPPQPSSASGVPFWKCAFCSWPRARMCCLGQSCCRAPSNGETPALTGLNDAASQATGFPLDTITPPPSYSPPPMDLSAMVRSVALPHTNWSLCSSRHAAALFASPAQKACFAVIVTQGNRSR